MTSLEYNRGRPAPSYLNNKLLRRDGRVPTPHVGFYATYKDVLGILYTFIFFQLTLTSSFSTAFSCVPRYDVFYKKNSPTIINSLVNSCHMCCVHMKMCFSCFIIRSFPSRNFNLTRGQNRRRNSFICLTKYRVFDAPLVAWRNTLKKGQRKSIHFSFFINNNTCSVYEYVGVGSSLLQQTVFLFEDRNYQMFQERKEDEHWINHLTFLKSNECSLHFQFLIFLFSERK